MTMQVDDWVLKEIIFGFNFFQGGEPKISGNTITGFFQFSIPGYFLRGFNPVVFKDLNPWKRRKFSVN